MPASIVTERSLVSPTAQLTQRLTQGLLLGLALVLSGCCGGSSDNAPPPPPPSTAAPVSGTTAPVAPVPAVGPQATPYDQAYVGTHLARLQQEAGCAASPSENAGVFCAARVREAL